MAATAADARQGPQSTAMDDFARLYRSRMEAMIEPDFDNTTVSTRGFSNLSYVVECPAGGLFDQHMLAIANGSSCDSCETLMRRGDDDDVQIGLDDGSPVGGRNRSSLVRQRVRFFFQGIANNRQGVAASSSRALVSNKAASDNAHTHCLISPSASRVRPEECGEAYRCRCRANPVCISENPAKDPRPPRSVCR